MLTKPHCLPDESGNNWWALTDMSKNSAQSVPSAHVSKCLRLEMSGTWIHLRVNNESLLLIQATCKLAELANLHADVRSALARFWKKEGSLVSWEASDQWFKFCYGFHPGRENREPLVQTRQAFLNPKNFPVSICRPYWLHKTRGAQNMSLKHLSYIYVCIYHQRPLPTLYFIILYILERIRLHAKYRGYIFLLYFYLIIYIYYRFLKYINNNI